MALNIKNPATVALAEELARRQGLSKTAAIHRALTDGLRHLGRDPGQRDHLLDDLQAIRRRIGQLPKHDLRRDEDIIGYDEHGVPN